MQNVSGLSGSVEPKSRASNISLASFGSICWFIGMLPPEFKINLKPAFNGLPSSPFFH